MSIGSTHDDGDFVRQEGHLDVDSIEKKGRKRSIALARSIICALAVDRLMLTDIARKLNLTPSGVSRLVARGRGESALRELEETLFEG